MYNYTITTLKKHFPNFYKFLKVIKNKFYYENQLTKIRNNKIQYLIKSLNNEINTNMNIILSNVKFSILYFCQSHITGISLLYSSSFDSSILFNMLSQSSELDDNPIKSSANSRQSLSDLISFSINFLFFALIFPGMFFVGILLGYQLHEEGVAHGCFPLMEDLSIAPIQTEKKGVVKFQLLVKLFNRF